MLTTEGYHLFYITKNIKFIPMKFKICLIALFVCISQLMSIAQEIAFVNANSVNVRQNPSSNSKIIGSLEKYSAVEIYNEDSASGWTPIAFFSEDGDPITAFISDSYITRLANAPISKDKFTGKPLYLKTAEDSDLTGVLELKIKGNDVIVGSYVLKSKEMMEAGGSGTIDSFSFEGVYNDGGAIAIYDNDSPVFYDPNYGVLYLLGYLWEIK